MIRWLPQALHPWATSPLGWAGAGAASFQARSLAVRFLSSQAADVEAVVIGAGVVGLAVARSLALAGREVLLLEGGPAFGTETSARNSEIIHAGIYYPSGSLKAALCVAGKNMLYQYCVLRDVPHKRLGKLIVATSEAQVPSLHALKAQAASNGVTDLELLSGEQARGLEPELRAVAALLSPSTGIIDSHGLMVSLLGDAERHGAVLSLNSRVVGGHVGGAVQTLRVEDTHSGEATSVLCKLLVNAGGLHAQEVARGLRGLAVESIPQRHLARGCYFTVTGGAPFSHLIYPVPEPGLAGLGTHLTFDLGGSARLGPDVEWVDEISYEVDPARGECFYDAVRTYWPGLRDGTLQPAYSGIRPKLSGPGQPSADFMVQGPKEHGVPGLVNLYGIESPGLTSCLALAEHVLDELGVPSAGNDTQGN